MSFDVVAEQCVGAGALHRNQIIHSTSIWIGCECPVWHVDFSQGLIFRELHQTVHDCCYWRTALKCHLGLFLSFGAYVQIRCSSAFIYSAADPINLVITSEPLVFTVEPRTARNDSGALLWFQGKSSHTKNTKTGCLMEGLTCGWDSQTLRQLINIFLYLERQNCQTAWHI